MDLVNARSSAFGYSGITDFLLSWPVLVCVVLVSVIGGAPYMPLFDLDEGAFSEATREILESGNWVSTYLNGVPRHDKPILIYWFQATSVQLFGIHPFSFRLPSMIASLAWIFVVYRFTREFFNERAARIAIWIFSTSWLATLIFKAAIADALLNWLLCLVFFDIYRYAKDPSNKRLALIGFYMGLGFLTKGPVILVLPIATSLVVLSLYGQFKRWLVAVFHPVSWGVLLATVIPWHVASYLDQGWGFFQGFYLGHNVGRFSDTMESHGGSPLYYVLLLPVLVAPFTRHFFAELFSLKGRKIDMLHAYLWVWFAITLAVFSFSKTQLPHYLLYGLSPVFILLAKRLSDLFSEDNGKAINWGDFAIGWGFVIFVACIPFALGMIIKSTGSDYERAALTLMQEEFYQGYHIVSVLLAVAVTAVVFWPKLAGSAKLMCCSALLMLAFNFVPGMLMAKAQQGPVRAAAKSIEGTDRNVVAYRIDMPSFSVYMNRIVKKTDQPALGDIVYTRIDREEKLKALNPDIEPILLFKQGGIALYQYGEKGE